MEAPTTHAPRSQLRRALRPALMLAALALVFGWLLPQFIDYQRGLGGADGTRRVGSGRSVRARARSRSHRGPDVSGVPAGLGLWRGSEAYLSSNFAGQLLPPPTASVVQYGYFRGGGYSADAAGLAAFGSFLFPTIGRFLLPLVALVVLLLTGEVNGSILLAGALSLAITAVAGIAGYFFLRGERSARWLGAKAATAALLDPREVQARSDRGRRREGGRTAYPGARRPARGLGAGVDRGRGQPLPHLPDPARSLRFVGVSSAELSAADAFAAFAIAFWAGAVFPITGSGLGVVDAVLIAMLIELSSASDDALVAAALLWRVFYSVLTLPLGAITLSRFRKANPDALTAGTVD